MPDFEDIDMNAMAEAMEKGDAIVEEAPSFEMPAPEDPSYTPPVEPAPAEEPITPPAAEPAAEPVVKPPVVEEPKTIIKEVEKIVEKYPEFKSEKAKQLFENLVNAEDPKVAEKSVLDYLREKQRDYTTMSDMDVVKAALRKENPTWTKEDVDLKIRRTYGKNLTPIDLNTIDKELDPDKYEQAEAHNEDVSNALADLRLDALQKRPTLIQQQQELELPTIKSAVQEPAPSGPTLEQIEAANKAWKEAVEASMGNVSSIKQTIDDKEVEYSLTDDEKKALNTKIENFNLLQFSKDRGWQNEDGTPNIQKLAEDVLKLENFDKISKSFGTQLKTEVTKDVLKSIKNVDEGKRPPQENGAPASLADAYFAAIDGASK